MTRRSAAHDYSRPGTYHITMHVAESLGHPLGAVVGSLDAPDGSGDAPHTVLTRTGQMVEHELLTAIRSHYPMVTVQDYVIMPDNLHESLQNEFRHWGAADISVADKQDSHINSQITEILTRIKSFVIFAHR